MTYSIVAIDREAGEVGVAVQSHYFGVGSLVPWARPGTGAVATQSVVRAGYGPELLDAIDAGRPPEDALRERVAADPGAGLRQVAAIDASGRVAVHTGTACIAAAGHRTGDGVSVQANLVAGEAVWVSMLDAFCAGTGSLVERMLEALDAAEAAGGDLRGRQAAAIRVVRTASSGDLAADTVLDVRVDDHPEPLVELRRLARASTALSGLVRLLEEPGLLGGPMTAAPAVVDAALAELDAAQRLLGSANGEPSAWSGLLLARLGRHEEARRHLARSAEAGLAPAALLRSLAAAGMWPGDVEDLVRLAPRGQR